jgi:hypothetical protein
MYLCIKVYFRLNKIIIQPRVTGTGSPSSYEVLRPSREFETRSGFVPERAKMETASFTASWQPRMPT